MQCTAGVAPNGFGYLVKNLWFHGPNHSARLSQKSACLAVGDDAKIRLDALAGRVKGLNHINLRGLKALLHHSTHDGAGHIAAAYKCNPLSHLVSVAS